MTSTWIGPTYRRPAVEVLTDEGERLPLPMWTGDGPCDHMLDRRGWVALHVGGKVFSIADGDLLTAWRLPEAWTILPAADPSLILIKRSFGRSRLDGEDTVIELADQQGQVLRTVSAADVWGVHGELESGWIVCEEALLSWGGERRPSPGPGKAIAVLRGRHIVLADRDAASVHVVDTDTNRTFSGSIPTSMRWFSPAYDRDATRVAFSNFGPGPIVVIDEHDVRVIETSEEVRHLAWFDAGHLLASGERGHWMVDIAAGTLGPATGFGQGSVPRIEISGRFDADQLRAIHQPFWHGPVSADDRASIVEASRSIIATGLTEAGFDTDLLDVLEPAVRLRSCVTGRDVPVGASRLGGRPDLPPGMAWPRYGGKPMMFVGQVRVDEINAALPGALPESDGLLMVFVALEADGGYPSEPDAVVVRVVPLDELRALPFPDDLPAELQLDMALAAVEPMLSAPNDDVDDDPAGDALWVRTATLSGPGPHHQMFGFPRTIQDTRAAEGQQLLLQFDGDPMLGGPELGDGGRLLIWGTPHAERDDGLIASRVELDCY